MKPIMRMMQRHAVFILLSLFAVLVLLSLPILNCLLSSTTCGSTTVINEKSRNEATAESIIMQWYIHNITGITSSDLTDSYYEATGGIARRCNHSQHFSSANSNGGNPHDYSITENITTQLNDVERTTGIIGISQCTDCVTDAKFSGKHTFYLKGSHQTVAGIGHAFMSFNHLVTLAFQSRLIPHFSFWNTGHGLDKQRTKAYFFGDFFDVFALRKKNDTDCQMIKSSTSKLATDVLHARNKIDATPSNSSFMECTEFILEGQTSPSELGMASNLPYYRRLFQINDDSRQKIMRNTTDNKEYSDAVNIAVHIRRGDVFSYLLAMSNNTENMAKQASSRLVPVSAYKSVLRQVISKLTKSSKTRVHVHIFCEGMKVPFLVEDVNGTYIDIRRDIIFDSSIQNVTFFHGTMDTLGAFDAMCFSDILVTGTSGFSYTVSILCKTPVILAVPFWHSYEYVPNAILLDVTMENYTLPNINNLTTRLISNMQFNEERFEELWQEGCR